ncbi:MAG: DUF2442 domain-containing protein [Kiritimatiellia bacterium]|jgi:hypothetical protein|nr:DUF2442 domain-containing protein [Kiritimatiellia bacterium]MDP6809614.1 DUF2442 domain-containing protein [Kiritimatiellia bacterium]MDP7023535.1 DUF2442 domain-containing protein [Kiritimatiellia bacterium]
MRSSTHGTSTISVENITPFGIWVNDGNREHVIPFSEFPCLKKASVADLMAPVLHHGFHLSWENLDIDIDLNSLDHLEDFPLYFESEAPALSAVAEERKEYSTG